MATEKQQLFLSADLEEEVRKKGFVTAPLLDKQAILGVNKEFKKLLGMVPEGIPPKFWPSGRFHDPKVRNFAAEIVEKYVRGPLEKMFLAEKAELMGGTMLIKPPGPETALYPHQDSSHVDEREFLSVYAWIPMVDTSPENGALHVIPGSHLFGNQQRSLNVPWQFDGLQEHMLKHVVPVNMKAGEVCFFHSAMIHYSSVNQTQDLRVAANYFIKPTESPFLHYYIDERTPKGKCEVFVVDIDFFHSGDFESRPPAKYERIRIEDHFRLNLSESEFSQKCNAFTSGNQDT